MADLIRTAAYIRKDVSHRTRNAEPQGLAGALKRELWELLRTPNTVDSLSRALTPTTRSTTADVDASVEDALKQWLEADLVELSPDS